MGGRAHTKMLPILLLAALAAAVPPRIITVPEDVMPAVPERTIIDEHWGKVELPPVPAFFIDTLDPNLLQDKGLSDWSQTGLRPWDEYIWDRVAILSQELRASNTFVDVGANLGYFTLAAAASGYDVVAFEAADHYARKLSRSVWRNGFRERVALYQNRVRNASDDLAVVALSEMFSQGADAHIVKVNAEGSEGAVLMGARHWICSSNVRHVVVEFSEATRANTEFPATEMFEFMQQAGYDLSDVALGTGLIPYDALTAGVFGHVPPNLLFSLRGANSTCIYE